MEIISENESMEKRDKTLTVDEILGVNIASRKSDEEHQYGHDRLECVAAIL